MAIQEGKSNLSFILTKAKTTHFAERPIPTLTDPHEVLIAIQYTGICGSDIHWWQHCYSAGITLTSPMVLGHESAGTIISVGSLVKSLKPGDKIALEPGFPCRRCDNCRKGKYNLCSDVQFAATPPVDGTLAGFYKAPEDFCFKLPQQMTLQEGALIEPLAVAVHANGLGKVSTGQNVVIMGAGPVGLLCCAVARARHAEKVVAVDVLPHRLEFAKGYAVTHTFQPSKTEGGEEAAAQANAERLKEEVDLPEGADVVIDATGVAASTQTALHVVRRGGRYVQVGHGKDWINFPMMQLAIKEITATGCYRYAHGDYKEAISLVAGGHVDVKKLITGVVHFEDALKAFEEVLAGRGIKTLIKGPNEP